MWVEGDFPSGVRSLDPLKLVESQSLEGTTAELSGAHFKRDTQSFFGQVSS